MLGILDTLALYTFAVIGFSVVLRTFYEYIHFLLFLMTQNVKYYFPTVYYSIVGVRNTFGHYLGMNKTQTTSTPNPENKEDLQTGNESRESELMDILSKSRNYYESMKELFELKIKDVPDPQLRNKIDKWYQKLTGLIESPITSSLNIQDLKKILYECTDELYELFELMERYNR